MGVWEIVGIVVGGWSLLSVLVGVVIGHAISGKSLRSRISTAESAVGSAVDAAFDAIYLPVSMMSEAFSAEDATFDAAV